MADQQQQNPLMKPLFPGSDKSTFSLFSNDPKNLATDSNINPFSSGKSIFGGTSTNAPSNKLFNAN